MENDDIRTLLKDFNIRHITDIEGCYAVHNTGAIWKREKDVWNDEQLYPSIKYKGLDPKLFPWSTESLGWLYCKDIVTAEKVRDLIIRLIE